MKVPGVKIHPLSEKLCLKGHPWILKDKFTEAFPNEKLLNAVSKNGRFLFSFFHDSDHPRIKGRLWSLTTESDGKPDNFRKELSKRLKVAIDKRLNLRNTNHLGERENYYLVFGEADYLPGLFIQRFSSTVFITYLSSFWTDYTEDILNSIDSERIYLQNRIKKRSPWEIVKGKPSKITFNEFGSKYLIKPEDPDLGFYTDMSSIRKQLKSILKSKNVIANLFSYTGAFSLYTLSQGVKEVHSVDLSNEYLKHLEENLSLNSYQGSHFSHKAEVIQWLKETNLNFDLIICDPPSASTDGKRKRNNLKVYEDLLPLLNKKSHEFIIFLNTHSIGRQKFKEKIEDIIRSQNLPLKIQKEFSLNADCPRLKGFPEGDYLKGFYLKKSN